MLTANSGDKSRSLVNKVSLVGGVREIWINIELLEGFEVEGGVGSTRMKTFRNLFAFGRSGTDASGE
jgi:hypothetical protein